MSRSHRRRRTHKSRWRYWLGGGILAGLIALAVILSRGSDAPDAEAQFAAGERAREARAYSAAIIHYKNTLLANPEFIEARWRLGQTYLALNRIPDALSELESARALADREPALWLDLAQAQVESGRFADSLRSLERYTGPAASQAEALKARAKLGLGETAAAKEVLNAATARDPNAASLHLATARLALSERDVAGAETAVNKALEAAPDDPAALRVAGRLHLLQHRTAEAVKTLRRATELQPEDLEGLSSLAEALLADGQIDAAAEVSGQLSKLAPGTVAAEFIAGWVAYAREDLGRVEQHLLGVVKIAPRHPQSLLMLGDALLKLGKYNQAEAHLKSFDEAYPRYPAARKLLASVYLRQHRPADAITALTPLADAEPADAGVLTLLSYAHYSNGDPAQGKEYLARAQTIVPDSPLLKTQEALGQIAEGNESGGLQELEALAAEPGGGASRQALTYYHLLRGNRDAALESAEALRALNDEDPMAHNLLGVAHASRGASAEARKAFEAALARDAKFAPALANLGLLALGENRTKDGEALLKRALAADRAYTAASLALATLAEQRGEQAEVDRLLADAAAAQPRAAQPRWRLAERKLRAGATAEALKLAEEAYGAMPKLAQSRLMWGVFLLRAGRAAEAVDVLAKLHADVPGLLPAAAALGDAARATGQWDLARSSYRKVLNHAPSRKVVLWGLFSVELAARDFVEAENLIREMEGLDDPLEAERARGELALAQGRHGEAVTAFASLQQRAPSSANLLRLADVLEIKGDIAELNRVLSAWLLNAPKDTAVRLRLGTIELVSGRTREAKATFETALEHAPDNPIALNNLAWLYHQDGDERALGLAERAYKALPDSAETTDTLAWIMVDRNDAQKALPLFERALQLAPDEPNIQYHHAYTLAELGNQAKARSLLEGLLEKHGKFQSENDARALLRRLTKADRPNEGFSGMRP